MSLEEYAAISEQGGTQITEDEWDKAIDGMIFETVHGPTFTGYVLLVQDPSRVFVGTSSDFKNGYPGKNIFDLTKKENAVAAINGGEFSDPGGQGDGSNPLGITYSKGVCVWNDAFKRTFIGFDKDNRLIVTEPMTKKQAEELSILHDQGKRRSEKGTFDAAGRVFRRILVCEIDPCRNEPAHLSADIFNDFGGAAGDLEDADTFIAGFNDGDAAEDTALFDRPVHLRSDDVTGISSRADL